MAGGRISATGINRTEQTRSEAPLYAEVVRLLAGGARLLYELASGHNPFDGEAPVSAINPQGRLGVDMSGPPWGSAILHPIGWATGVASTANMLGERRVLDDVLTGFNVRLGPWIIWNRPHARLVGNENIRPIAPYSWAHLRFRAVLNAGGPATLTVGLGAFDLVTGAEISRSTTTVSVTTTETSFDVSTVMAGPLGRGHTAVFVDFSHDNANEVDITCLSLLQAVKRSH